MVEAGYEYLKPEQLQAIDVVIFLPSGHGKSLIYGLLVIVVERLQRRPEKTSVALVISPLSALKVTFHPKRNQCGVFKRVA